MARAVVLALALLLGGCMGLEGAGEGAYERVRSSVSDRLFPETQGPTVGIQMLERGHAGEAARIFGAAIERSRRPGQVSLRGELYGLLGADEGGSLALVPTEQAVLLLLHGTALYRSGEMELAGTRARLVLQRSNDLEPSLECWALQLLAATDRDAGRRQAHPTRCPLSGEVLVVTLGGREGPIRDRVRTERRSAASRLERFSRDGFRSAGVPWQTPPDWVPGAVESRLLERRGARTGGFH